MTDRNMTPTLLTATEKTMVQYYELVHLDVGPGYRITNSPYDITYDGHTYTAAGALLDFDAVQENISFEIERLSIKIGGIDPLPGDSDPFIKKVLTLDYVDRPVYIYRVYFEANAQVDGLLMYSGYINSASLASGLGPDGAAVNIETSNNWTDFGKMNGRFTNDTSQKTVFPNDDGFEYSKQVQKQVEWKAEE